MNEPGLLHVLRSNLERPRHARLAGLYLGDLTAREPRAADRTSTPAPILNARDDAFIKEGLSATVLPPPLASKAR